MTRRKRGTSYALRYVAGSDLGRRFRSVGAGRYRTREEAEAVRAECINAEHIEVVEIPGSGSGHAVSS